MNIRVPLFPCIKSTGLSQNIQAVQFILFARSGFTPALEEQAKAEGIGLYTVDSLVKNP
jgi:hypothetical protein